MERPPSLRTPNPNIDEVLRSNLIIEAPLVEDSVTADPGKKSHPDDMKGLKFVRLQTIDGRLGPVRIRHLNSLASTKASMFTLRF